MTSLCCTGILGFFKGQETSNNLHFDHRIVAIFTTLEITEAILATFDVLKVSRFEHYRVLFRSPFRIQGSLVFSRLRSLQIPLIWGLQILQKKVEI